MVNIAWNVCVSICSVLPYSFTSTYIEWAKLIPQLKRILMYCVKCQRRPGFWSIFPNNPNRFCYICRNVARPNRQVKTTDFVNRNIPSTFCVKLGFQDRPFAPYVCGKNLENLSDWRNDKRNSMLFAIPIVGRVGKYYITDYYLYLKNLIRINRKNKHLVLYPDVPSAIRPIPNASNFPVPGPDGNMVYSTGFHHSDMPVVSGGDAYKPEVDQPVPLTKVELDDLTRDINLSKESAQLLGSRLK